MQQLRGCAATAMRSHSRERKEMRELRPAGALSVGASYLPHQGRLNQDWFQSRLATLPCQATSARCQSVVRDKPRQAENHKERATTKTAIPATAMPTVLRISDFKARTCRR